MTSDHPSELLGLYQLGALGPEEVKVVDDHAATCTRCRQELGELGVVVGGLGQVPPEAFVDGPPEGTELLLARTLRQARSETARPTTWLAAAVLVLVLGALGGGLLLGRSTTSSSPLSSPAGSTQLTAVEAGVHMVVVVIPAHGWVRLQGAFTGVPANARCYLIVVDRSGHRFVAGSWLAPAVSPAGGERVDGSALVPPADVASVEVVTFGGKVLDTANV
jgi:anti-sigma factor RsiW